MVSGSTPACPRKRVTERVGARAREDEEEVEEEEDERRYLVKAQQRKVSASSVW